MKRMLILPILIVPGCSANIADLDCSDVADEAIGVSEGELIAINNQRMVSKNDQRIVCNGIGFTNGGQEIPIRFQAFYSDKGDILVSYDDNAHQANLARQVKQEMQQEEDRIKAEVRSMMNEFRSNLR